MLGYTMISGVFAEEECGFIPALARKLKTANGTNEILFSAESSPAQLASVCYICRPLSGYWRAIEILVFVTM